VRPKKLRDVSQNWQKEKKGGLLGKGKGKEKGHGWNLEQWKGGKEVGTGKNDFPKRKGVDCAKGKNDRENPDEGGKEG